MHILCVTANYPPHHTGGYEVSCQDVMDRLVARGHRVTVLTGDDRVPGVATPSDERRAEPAVRRDIIRYFKDDDLWKPNLVTRWRVERHNQRAFAEALAASRADVVAVWHVGAFSLGIIAAAIESDVPVVYAPCDDWPSYCVVLDQWISAMEKLGAAARPLRHVLRVPTVAPDIGASGAHCFVSECTRQRNVRQSRWTFDRWGIVYSGIDRSLFAARTEPPPWRWRLLSVGRIDPRKGIETLVRALPLLPPEATAEIRGSGAAVEIARLQAIAAELGVAERITWGRLPREELPDAYRAADVFVFPSQWQEPFGLVPLEAMECGTPVVATAEGGTAEFLADERNCLVFRTGEPEDLARVLHRMADDAELRARLTRAGFATAQYFDVEKLTDVFEQWYLAATVRYANGQPESRHFALD